MPSLPDMTNHRGFPGGMPGTGVQFTIRRANPRGDALEDRSLEVTASIDISVERQVRQLRRSIGA